MRCCSKLALLDRPSETLSIFTELIARARQCSYRVAFAMVEGWTIIDESVKQLGQCFHVASLPWISTQRALNMLVFGMKHHSVLEFHRVFHGHDARSKLDGVRLRGYCPSTQISPTQLASA